MKCGLFKRAVLAVLTCIGPAFAADQDVSVKTPTGILWGSYLAVPKARAAVLILPGSGPTDRNGNNAMGLHTDAYKMLATGLAAHGIASLRIDKRGIGESAPALLAEADLRFQTNADDADAWVAELKRRTGLSCVWLAGHSEGALVAELAAQANPDICGLVLIAGAGRKAGDIIREQLNANPANPPELKAAAFADLNALEAGQTVADPPPALMSLFRPSVQPYMISWLRLDPAALLAKLKIPVLIVQGDNDLQVAVQDAKLLAAARPDAKLMIVSGMNHILKIVPANRAANFASYGDPSLPLAPGLIDSIAAFILH